MRYIDATVVLLAGQRPGELSRLPCCRLSFPRFSRELSSVTVEEATSATGYTPLYSRRMKAQSWPCQASLREVRGGSTQGARKDSNVSTRAPQPAHSCHCRLSTPQEQPCSLGSPRILEGCLVDPASRLSPISPVTAKASVPPGLCIIDGKHPDDHPSVQVPWWSRSSGDFVSSPRSQHVDHCSGHRGSARAQIVQLALA